MTMVSRRTTILLCVLALVAALPAAAGTLDLAWDPSDGADGYRLYESDTAGSYPADPIWEGPTTEATVTGLADCSLHYFVVTAYNASGESAYSNEISSWPRPEVNATDPPSGERGSTLDVTIQGINYQDGATVNFGDPAIVVNSTAVQACGSILVNITIGAGAALGPTDVEVTNPDGLHGTGTDVFTVQDSSAPVITEVASGAITGTTATITWTTDEAADSQVLYRKTGTQAYQQTQVDPAMVTAHSVLLEGLEPSSAYEYHVRSADAQENAGESSPDDTFITSDNPYAYLRFEAEAGDLVAPVRKTSGNDAFGQAWIDTPVGGDPGTAADPLGTATYGVNLPSAGTWFVWLRMYAPEDLAASWFESVNGGQRVPVSIPSTGSWIWVSANSHSLDAGLNTLELAGHEPGARVDRVLMTDDPAFVPTEQAVGDVMPTAPVTDLTATPSHTRVDLAWTNPSDGDYARTVIRYRTDGRYPVSPVDGFAVTDQAGQPGAADNFAHTGLTDGVTYLYSVFAVDSAGNISDAARVEATPWDDRPPAAPTGLHVVP